jgi:hydantoinase/carbamoylase family amidase
MTASLMQRLEALARVSDAQDGLTRLFLSNAHSQAARMVAGWMEDAGLAVRLDALGNVVGRSDVPGPVLLLGSHIDTVRDAGWYDGNFGVAAAIEAMRRLHRAGESLKFGVEVIAFGDEEGVRFAHTLAGSRATAGVFDAAALEDVDADGMRMADALAAFGGDPAGVAAVARRKQDVLGYVELHIEQGPVLEARNLGVGVVTAINGASRFSVMVTGSAGHAGTVPMGMRRDALSAASEMVLAVETIGCSAPGLVATVGSLDVHPGAPNSVPGRVVFSVDVRAPKDFTRNEASAKIRLAFEDIAERRKISMTFKQGHDAPATPCAASLQAQLAAAVQACGVNPFHLASGAGHDAMAMAALCPVGMLFVRCEGGISHTPDENISEADAELAVDVLVEFLRKFQAE